MKIFNKNEWKKVKLGDVCEVITGNTPLKKIKEYWDKDEVPFITPPELKYEGINYITPNIYVSKIGAKQGRIIPKNSICVCCIGSLGKLGILKEDAITNQQINSLILKNKNVDLLYLYFYLKNIKNNLESIDTSTTVKIINKSSFEKIDINLPSLEIQKKISKKLELLENNIDFRKRQLNYLKDLTKSLFTTMFGDIKTNDKNWEIYYWKDVLNIKNGKNQKQVEDINGKYPIYGSGGIIGRSNAYICNENSIIIGRKGNINKPILVKEKFWNVDTAFGLEVKSEKMSYHYLYYFCLFYDFEIHNKAVTIPSLVKSDLEKIVLPVPPIELQNKFAERVEKIEKLSFNLY